jgi:3-oxoacyl-[acyl-carrier protein] reductase
MKSIIVTGDSRGLGNAIVRLLLKDENYFVVGISRSASEETRNNELSFSQRYVHINFDLANYEGIKQLYWDNLKQYGPIFGLVNNAGMAYDDIVTNAHADSLVKMFQVNVFSSILLSKYIIRDMILNETKGSLVHISSVCAHTGYNGLSMYSASKGAIEAFSRTVAREWGGRGIRSNCVAPGFMDTEMSARLSNNQKMRIYRRTSLKTATDIESISEMINFLLSEKSKSITGATFPVDSGTI